MCKAPSRIPYAYLPRKQWCECICDWVYTQKHSVSKSGQSTFRGSEIHEEEEERVLMCPPCNSSSSLWQQNAPCLSALLLHILVCCGGFSGCWLSELSSAPFLLSGWHVTAKSVTAARCGGQGMGCRACWSLERCILLAVEYMCSYVPEYNSREGLYFC